MRAMNSLKSMRSPGTWRAAGAALWLLSLLLTGAPVTASVLSTSAPVREVAFIDTGLADWQVLRDGVKPGVEVVLLDAGADGLAQMAAWAQGRSGYDAIYLLSHGNSGAIKLGALTLDGDNLQQHSDTLARIGSALTADGDFLVYGCNVAEGPTGVEFVGKLAQATGADVGASDDLTGASGLGGDWELESASGVIDLDPSTLVLGSFGNFLGNIATVVGTTSGTAGADTFVVAGGGGFDVGAIHVYNAGTPEDELSFSNIVEDFQASTDRFSFANYGLSIESFTFEKQSQLLWYDNASRGVAAGQVVIVTPGKLDGGVASSTATSGTDGTIATIFDEGSFSLFSFFLPGVNYNDLALTNFYLPTNTAPTLTATGTTPTFTQGSSTGVDLFSNVAADTIDSGQTFTGATFTVTNVYNTTEYLTIGGIDVALTNGGSTALTGLGATASVAVASGVATVTITGLTRTNAEMVTLIDNVT